MRMPAFSEESIFSLARYHELETLYAILTGRGEASKTNFSDVDK
jgi:hypothetical protein